MRANARKHVVPSGRRNAKNVNTKKNTGRDAAHFLGAHVLPPVQALVHGLPLLSMQSVPPADHSAHRFKSLESFDTAALQQPNLNSNIRQDARKNLFSSPSASKAGGARGKNPSQFQEGNVCSKVANQCGFTAEMPETQKMAGTRRNVRIC